ncbi:MAG: hypothetical protein AB7T22_13630, partial [Calditrichaceae bacterium]
MVYLLYGLNSAQVKILADVRGRNHIQGQLVAGRNDAYLFVRKSSAAGSGNVRELSAGDPELAGFFEKIF